MGLLHEEDFHEDELLKLDGGLLLLASHEIPNKENGSPDLLLQSFFSFTMSPPFSMFPLQDSDIAFFARDTV